MKIFEWSGGAGARKGTGKGMPRAHGGSALPAAAAIALLAIGAMTLPSHVAGQERIDERRPLASDGRLDVQVVNHGVRIEAWDQNEVHLTGTLDPASQRLEVSGSDRGLTIRIEQSRGTRSGTPGTLELRVPRDARLAVATVSGDIVFEGTSGTVRGQTVSGAVRLDGSPSRAELHTVSGRIESTGRVADLQLHAVSGDIRVRGATSRVDVHAVSGRIEIEGDGSLERIRANNVSGGVELTGRLAPRATVDIDSHSGTIVLRIPSDTPAEFEMGTFSGSIRNRLTGDEPQTQRFSNTLRFRIGDATARVRLNTFSGSVTLEPMG